MTILCSGNCHVWLGASSLCTCEAHRVAMLFPGYNPFLPHAPQPTPTAPDPQGGLPGACVPLAQFKAAQAIKDATHLSSDGERVYSQRMGNVRVYYWDEETKAFGSSFPCASGLPADAVVLK